MQAAGPQAPSASRRVESSRKTTLADLFTPKLITVLREGYGLRDLRADVLAGLTVAIVALPLSMAIAIASGVTPDRGLYTSIVGGFIISALGGSRFQIGGPAGAFIVLVAATLNQHGLDGLLLAIFLSGLMLMAVGLLRLGSLIKFIPYPVTVGFTSGIAVIIFSGEIAELLGLRLAGKEPGPIVPKFVALAASAATIDWITVAISALSVAVIVALRRWRPHWPAYLIAVIAGGLVVWLLQLPVATIGSRFGGIPNSLPLPQLPPLSLAKIVEVLPAAGALALLGSIESLLSAVVADSMSGGRHRSNAELVAQGVANIASPLFGGLSVTGTIARTATNVRAGARGPIAGMLHALFVLVFMLVAAPLARYIPLATLASVLAVVCWNMAERHQFAALVRSSPGDAAVVIATFLVVVFRDLTEGILVGFAMAMLLFMHRMSHAVDVQVAVPPAEDDADDRDDGRGEQPFDASLVTDPDVVTYRISGAFFFGAAANVADALDRIAERPKAYVIDMSSVSIIDSSAAAAVSGFVRRAQRRGALVYIAGAQEKIRRALSLQGLGSSGIEYWPGAAEAAAAARMRLRAGETL